MYSSDQNQRSLSWLLAAALVAVGLAYSTTAAAQDEDASFRDAPYVTFESVWVQSRSGRLQVNYEIADKDWKRLQDADADLWVTLYFPSEFTPPTLEPTYSVEMDERSSTAKFPRWLRPPDGDRVGMCISATGPGDNLGMGRGYLCNEVVERKVYGSQKPTRQTSMTARMTHFGGVQPYPLPGTLPGFNPPTPPNLPQLPSSE
jgi:hypothetical protein